MAPTRPHHTADLTHPVRQAMPKKCAISSRASTQAALIICARGGGQGACRGPADGVNQGLCQNPRHIPCSITAILKDSNTGFRGKKFRKASPPGSLIPKVAAEQEEPDSKNPTERGLTLKSVRASARPGWSVEDPRVTMEGQSGGTRAHPQPARSRVHAIRKAAGGGERKETRGQAQAC